MTTRGGQITLVNFFIFNSEYGPREGEEEKKILFYHPSNAHIDNKIKNIGLSEAIVKFIETFSDKPCESVHTQKTRQIFFEPETNFWMVMTISLPFVEKSKDGKTYIEYKEDDVQDSVFEAVLRQAYRMFQFFNGTYDSIVERGEDGVQALKQRLDHFFSRYLMSLMLNQSDIIDVFNGIHFLPLDKNTYLRIQCFINHLEATFPYILYTAFLYNNQLVWSGLDQDDMRIMYKYLTTSLFPSFMDQELHGGQSRSPAIGQTPHFAQFIAGPQNLKDETNLGKIPRVFINTEEQNEECQLLVYKAMSSSICLLVSSKTTVTMEMCRKLDSMLAPEMSKLSSDISEQYSKRPAALSTSDPQFKYIYFNHMNLAQKTTVHVDIRKRINVNIPPETLRLLSDINADLTRGMEDGETIVKTLSDYWVVGKKSDQREFYVVINQKNANLIEINEEVKKLCSMHLNSIFFLD